MEDDKQSPAVEAPDTNAAFLAAFDRVRSIPASETLIDVMDDALWSDEAGEDWDINCGSEKTCPDELDSADLETDKVA